MSKREYSKAITRDYLEYLGVTDVTRDGKIYVRGQLHKTYRLPKGYYIINLYDPMIRLNTPVEERKNSTGALTIPVHRLMYAWFNSCVDCGQVIDHKNDNKSDNILENLRAVTSAENLYKGRPAWNTKEMKCKLDKPRSYYEDKLKYYVDCYEEAKRNKDSKLAHKWRTYTSQYRAKLRYYDSRQNEKN